MARAGVFSLAVVPAAMVAVVVRLVPWPEVGGLDRALPLLTSGTLLLPVFVSCVLLFRQRRGAVPLAASTVCFLLFAPRVMQFDPTTGLISDSALAPGELMSATRVAQVVLVIFSTTFAVFLLLADRRSDSLQRPVATSKATKAWTRGVRVPVAVVLGVVASFAAIADGVALGPSARDFGTSSVVGPLALLPAGPVAGALWLAGRPRLSLLFLVLSASGPFLTGSRQSVLTPLLYLFFAILAVRRRTRAGGGRPHAVIGILVAAGLIMSAVVVGTTSRRAAVATAINGGERQSAYEALILSQNLFDPMVTAVAREPRPQGTAIYERALAIPIPRQLWPEKPLSYDFDFRRRNFPAYGGALPITLIGTSFLSFGYSGVVLAGMLLALISLAVDRLLWRVQPRPVLMGVALMLFVIDVVRIGGLYREFLTLFLHLGVVLLLSRSSALSPQPLFRDVAVSRPAGTLHSNVFQEPAR